MRLFRMLLGVLLASSSTGFTMGAETADGPMITVEVRFISLSDEMLQACGLTAPVQVDTAEDATPLPTYNVPEGSEEVQRVSARSIVETRPVCRIQTLSNDEVGRLVRLAQQDRRSNLMFCPKMTLRSGTEGTVADETRRPFVVAPASGPDGGPTIRTVEIGTLLRIRPEIIAPGRMGVTGRIRLRSLDDVVAVKLDGLEQQVQVPTVSETTLEFRSPLKSRESLAVWTDGPSPRSADVDKKSRLPSWLGGKSSEPVETRLIVVVTLIEASGN